MTFALDAANSELSLWTYKAGLLSRVAHDLCLRATECDVALERTNDALSVTVSVPVASLRVQGQVKGGQVTPLSPKDHREIEESLAGAKVLDAARFPAITYTGQGTVADGAVHIDGQLTLKDRTQPLPVRATLAEGEPLRVQGEVRFLQSTFGVKPFSALMGALKVKDEVRVSWDLRFRAAIVDA